MALGIQRTLLYEEVVSELYRMIDQGQIKLGEAFPSERVLVDRWNISRNVLREAFHVLEAPHLFSLPFHLPSQKSCRRCHQLQLHVSEFHLRIPA